MLVHVIDVISEVHRAFGNLAAVEARHQRFEIGVSRDLRGINKGLCDGRNLFNVAAVTVIPVTRLDKQPLQPVLDLHVHVVCSFVSLCC